MLIQGGTVIDLEGPVFDLATTTSRFLHLGLALDEVVAMPTAAPARTLCGGAGLGTLAPGAAADVTVVELTEGRFELEDALGDKVTASQRLVVRAVVPDGRRVAPKAPRPR